jgi:hypothetical protein
MADKLDLSGGTMTGALVLPNPGDGSYPSQPAHAATKQYVDSVAQGLDVKGSVKCATTANITLSGTQTIDGVAVSAGHRVLVKNQSTASQNGIYEVAAGAWSRASDMDAWTEVPGAFCFVEQGTVNADTGWVCTADQGGTIGTTAVSWSQFAGVGNYTADGQGIELSGTQFALELDGNSLSKSASGLKVNPSGDITAASLSSGVINATGYQDFSAVATPSSPSASKLRAYAKSDGKLYTLNSSGIEQAVGSGGSIVLINKVGHGFLAADVGCPVYLNASGDYVKARADLSTTCEVAGLINKRIDADNFEVCLGGEVTSVGANALSPLVVGEVYYVSATTAGALTATEPTTVGHISKPVGVARTTSAIEFFNSRGVVVGGANARTQITLANSTTTTVQDVSAYDAGELAGWVSLVNSTAANSLRFYVQAPFAKKGNTASPDYFISPSYVGDTPPAGFSMSVTSAGVIQITMPNWSGFSSGVINYALNAPAVGTNFPLSVGGDSVNGGTPTVLGIKALDANGLYFKDDNGNTTGTVDDTGQWTIGSSSSGSNVTNTVYGKGRAAGSDGSLEVSTNETVASSDTSLYSFIKLSKRRSGANTAYALIGVNNSSTAVSGNSQLSFWIRNSSDSGSTQVFYVSSNGTKTFINGSINIGSSAISSGAGTSTLKWDGNTGAVTYDTSSSLVKENIVDCPYGLDTVMSLQARKYFRKDDKKDEIGFIADEVVKLIPEVVPFVEKKLLTNKEDDTDLVPGSVNYEKLTAVLVKAVQELKTELDAVKSELAALKK